MFKPGDFIESNGKVGKVFSVYFDSYSVQIGEYERATFMMDTCTQSSQQAYDAQIAAADARLKAARLALRQKRNPAVLRWLCLDCGNKYNGSICPTCDGEERIYNTDKDLDPSLPASQKAEPYAPGDDA